MRIDTVRTEKLTMKQRTTTVTFRNAVAPDINLLKIGQH